MHQEGQAIQNQKCQNLQTQNPLMLVNEKIALEEKLYHNRQDQEIAHHKLNPTDQNQDLLFVEQLLNQLQNQLPNQLRFQDIQDVRLVEIMDAVVDIVLEKIVIVELVEKSD